MIKNENQTRIYVSDYDNQMMPTYDNPIYGLGNSQVSEPEIINPINLQEYTPHNNGAVSLQDIENNLPQGGTSQLGTSVVVQPEIKSNTEAEPSATTEETKTYIDGGTTPDSPIVVNKPKPNYLMLGLLGIVGALVVYKLFFSKKSE